MRIHPAKSLLITLFCSQSVLAMDIGMCIPGSIEGNPTYYGLMTTNTKLQCELQGELKRRVWTAPELYQQGWRLIDVVGGDATLATGGKGPAPMYMFERAERPPVEETPDTEVEAEAAAEAETPAAAEVEEAKEESGGFRLFRRGSSPRSSSPDPSSEVPTY